MQVFFVLILLVSFVAFLFALYGMSNDDFVLFRKHAPIERVFNIAFLVAVVGLLTARIFYVAFHFTPGFLNPLVFFLFPYFPGLSLAGGMLGGAVFLTIFSQKSNLPTGRLLDFFALCALSALSLGFLLEALIAAFVKKAPIHFGVILAFFYCVLFVAFTKIFQKGKLADGSIGCISLLSFSLITFVASFVEKKALVFFFLSKDDFLLIGIFVASLTFLIRQEKKGIEAFFSQVSLRFR